jgi:hypothetical protein
MIVIGAVALQITPQKLIRDAWAQSGERAVGFVKSTSEQLAAIVNSTDSPQEMRGRLILLCHFPLAIAYSAPM